MISGQVRATHELGFADSVSIDSTDEDLHIATKTKTNEGTPRILNIIRTTIRLSRT